MASDRAMALVVFRASRMDKPIGIASEVLHLARARRIGKLLWAHGYIAQRNPENEHLEREADKIRRAWLLERKLHTVQ